MAPEYLQNSVTALRESISDATSRPVPLVLAATAGTLGAWLIWTKWRYRNRKLPPNPRAWPLVGNLLDLSDDGMHLDLIRLQKKHKLPDIFTLQMGPAHKLVVLNTFDVIKDALVSQGDLFSHRPPSAGIDAMKLQDDIITKDFSDPEWKSSKTFVMSALRSVGFGNTKSSEEKILGQFDLMVEGLEPLIQNNEAVDFSRLLEKTAANVIFEILFNKKFTHDDPELAYRIQLVRDWTDEALNAFTLEMIPKWLCNLFFRKTLQRLFRRTEDFRVVVREEASEHQETLDPENPKDFMDIYLTKKKGVVDVDILANTMLFFTPDAIGTMGAFINWIILYVTAHPATMKRIQNDIEKVTGGNRHVTMSDRTKLPFAEAVIMEVARVACPVTTTALHSTSKDTYFRGYFIPKDMNVICNLYNAMRDPNNFERPDEFNPDRYLDKDGNLIRCDAWIPFGMGARKCAGEQLTKTELFLFTTNLFQRYDFSFPKEHPTPTLNPQSGHFVRGPEPFKVILKSRV